MSLYFRSSLPVTWHEYSLLCHRLAFEAYGCPLVGPYDERTLEVRGNRPDDKERAIVHVFETSGFVKIAPPSAPRNPLPLPGWPPVQ